jgi:hypothetical protein
MFRPDTKNKSSFIFERFCITLGPSLPHDLMRWRVGDGEIGARKNQMSVVPRDPNSIDNISVLDESEWRWTRSIGILPKSAMSNV